MMIAISPWPFNLAPHNYPHPLPKPKITAYDKMHFPITKHPSTLTNLTFTYDLIPQIYKLRHNGRRVKIARRIKKVATESPAAAIKGAQALWRPSIAVENPRAQSLGVSETASSARALYGWVRCCSSVFLVDRFCGVINWGGSFARWEERTDCGSVDRSMFIRRVIGLMRRWVKACVDGADVQQALSPRIFL